MDIFSPPGPNKVRNSTHPIPIAAPAFDPRKLAANRLANRFGLSKSVANTVAILAGIGGGA